jgi:hypothetical protein
MRREKRREMADLIELHLCIIGFKFILRSLRREREMKRQTLSSWRRC